MVEDQGGPAVTQAPTSWEAALEIDPRFKTALQRLEDSLCRADRILSDRATLLYGKFKDIASRLVKVDPSDRAAAANVYIADIAQWESGVGSFDKNLAASVAALSDIQKHDPSNDDALFYLGRAKIHMARDLRQAGDNRKSRTRNRRVAKVDSSIQRLPAQPQNAALNYRGVPTLRFQPESNACQAGGWQGREGDLGDAALARARENIKPTDHLYEDTITETADRAIEDGKREEGEKIFREYYGMRPNDRWARLRFAEALRRSRDASKREEAIRILRLPIQPQHEKGVRGVQVKQLEQQALEELLRLRLDQYAATTQPSERTTVMGQIDDTFKQISSNVHGESVGLLRLQARKSRKPKAIDTARWKHLRRPSI